MAVCRTTKRIVAEAIRQGFRYRMTTGNHHQLFPPDPTQPPIVISGTPSDWRSVKNSLAMLKRAGFKVEGDEA